MGRLIGVFWSSIWLFWLFQPLAEGWKRRDSIPGVLGMVTVVVFAALYVAHFLARSQVFADQGPQRVPRAGAVVVLRFVALWTMALALIACLGQVGSVALIFAAISAMWTFPLRGGLAISVLTGVGYAIACTLVPGWIFDSGSLIGLGFASLAVTAGILANRRQRVLALARLENAQLAVQAERNRMARDLHDILGHSLTVITVKAELAHRLMDIDPGRAKTEVADLERLSRSALSDVRRAVEGFREISLAGELTRAKSALAAAGIAATVPTALDEVDEDLHEVFAWTVRESVTNVLRHSQAKNCTITINPQEIIISDDGIGVNDPSGGNGLIGLRERARMAGAQLSLSPVVPHGTTVRLGVPGAPA